MSKCKICNVECPSTFCDDCSKMVGQGITALTADRDKWRDRCERLISWYGHPQEWRCNVSRYNYGHECSLDECVKREYNSGSHGYDFAQQIQKEIDDDRDIPTEKVSQSADEK